MKHLKQLIHRVLRRSNRWLLYSQPGAPTGWDLGHDLKTVIVGERPLILDVGANIGQSIDLFCEAFRNPVIHAFEPTPSCVEALRSKRWSGTVHIHPYALGDSSGRVALREYQLPVLNSVLLLDPQMGKLTETTPRSVTEVQMRTLDAFAEEFNIRSVDLLKSDTQGFDLHVLRGARRLFENEAIKAVMIELNHGEVYQGQDQMIAILQFLDSHGFLLVDHYDKVREGAHLAWSTALLVRRQKASAATVD